MKKNLILVVSFLSCVASYAQTTLVGWDFSSSVNTATSGLPANASRTVTNNASGTTSFPGTTSGSCTAPYILNSNWTSGSGTKYWQISFASTGYQAITVSFDARSSATGPADFKLQMSTTSPGTSGYSDVPNGSYMVADILCDPYGSFALPIEADDKSNV